ncbi:MAG: 3'-5' exonuclease, partial [Maribacter sp.]
ALEGMDVNGKTGSLFLVGDAKQAIYRWRGGKAEQFLDLASKKSNPFSVPGNIYSLPKNYRSQEEIIIFNNLFFQSISPFFENPTYRQFFEEGNQQQTNNKKEGYVNLSFLEEETDEGYAEKTLAVINGNLSNGYNYGDICILVRKKKHGILLSNFLLNSNVPVISPDALLLSNNRKVCFLVNLMRFKLQPDEHAISYEILNFLSEEKEDRHNYIQKNLNALNSFLKEEFNFDFGKFGQESIYDGIEYALKTFDLIPSSDAHISAFVDIVFEVEQKYGPDLQYLMDYWDKKEDTFSISTPENADAVQVMTIHRAKGLEFPVVVFPYANTNIFEEIEPKLWIPVNENDFLGFEELLIDKKQEVKDYGNREATIFREEEHKLMLDAYNLLYVALTRAVEALYIISYKDLEKNGSYKTKYFSGLFIHFLSSIALWNPENLEYTFGQMPSKTNNKNHLQSNSIIPYIYTHKERSSFTIVTKAGMLWESGQDIAINQGNVIHHILGNIKIYDDLDMAILKAIQKGIIYEQETAQIKFKIQAVITHSEISLFFKKGSIVLNEKDVLMADGTIVRPDRVIINNGNVTIIDYKTGNKSSRYQEQIDRYANAYNKMGYKVENKIIVYINENIVTEFT